MFKLTRFQMILIAGDLLTIAAVTLAGFASHDTLGTAGTRILTTFLPLAAAWFLIGPHVGVFDPARVRDRSQLWRPFWAMILAAPLFGLLRAGMLGAATIVAIFLVVIGGIAALAILAWRFLFLLFIMPRLAR